MPRLSILGAGTRIVLAMAYGSGANATRCGFHRTIESSAIDEAA